MNNNFGNILLRSLQTLFQPAPQQGQGSPYQMSPDNILTHKAVLQGLVPPAADEVPPPPPGMRFGNLNEYTTDNNITNSIPGQAGEIYQTTPPQPFLMQLLNRLRRGR